MADFNLSMSRLYASLVGMHPDDAREFRTMAATLQAPHVHGLAIDRRIANLRTYA